MGKDSDLCASLGLSDIAAEWAKKNPDYLTDVKSNIENYAALGVCSLVPLAGMSLMVEIMAAKNHKEAAAFILSGLERDAK